MVYSGSADGFDPETEGTPVATVSTPSATISGLTLSGSYQYLFRVAATNGYYSAVADLAFSDTLEVAPGSIPEIVYANDGTAVLANDGTNVKA